LQGWETGELQPTISQLRKVASVYKRPLAVFFLSELPKTFDAMKDFRRIAEIGEVKKSPHLLLEIRRAQYRRAVAIELSEEMDEEIPLLNLLVSLNDDPEILGLQIRNILNISIESQKGWNNPYESFNAWKNSIENLGILVFQTTHTSRIDLSEMRGFSISEKVLPAIVLNSKDKPNGKIFTLLHELIHLLLNNAGICDLEENRSPKTENQRVEIFCNHVSGATLVPMDEIISNEIVNSKGNELQWTDSELSELATFFSVSKEVILRRLLISGRTTETFYKSKRDEYIEFYQRTSETESEGFPPYYRLVIRNNGTYYIKMILNAYYQEFISSSQLSDYIGAKLNHLSKIENALSI
jgi:Zn-dependent peptidase ImmA (M78 family)